MSIEKEAGLLASDNILAIQSVRRTQAGSYSCSASNSLATNTSKPLVLDVKCKSDISSVNLTSPPTFNSVEALLRL